MASDIKLNDNGVVVEGGELHSSGSGAGFSFADRTAGEQGDALRWVWYARDTSARLWSQVAGNDRVVVNFMGHVGIGTEPSRPLHVEGHEIHSGGPGAGFSFADRTTSKLVNGPQQGERWVWYADGGRARLWSGTDRMSIHHKDGVRIEGNLQVTGAVTQASSGALKDHVAQLSTHQAMAALQGLRAVTYTYKADDTKEQHVGFIAEDVPDLVANADHTAMSAMDVVAVLTTVVQEQQRTIAELAVEVNTLKQRTGGR